MYNALLNQLSVVQFFVFILGLAKKKKKNEKMIQNLLRRSQGTITTFCHEVLSNFN